jgi:hypothetical protein
VVNFWFSLESSNIRSVSHSTWLFLSVKLPSSFLWFLLSLSPQLNLQMQLRMALTASRAVFLLQPSEENATGFLSCWQGSWVGGAVC